MEIKSINELVAAPYNPRIMDKQEAESLDRSIEKFGDISGITKNVRTGFLVTGHQRINILKKRFMPELIKIHIEKRNDQPDQIGTIATGYVSVDGTNIKLNYREVDWSPDFEKAANIAANRISGRWDIDLLQQVNHELAQLENASELLISTGQSEKEIERMLKASGAIDDSGDEPKQSNMLEFFLTADQREIVEEALENIKATRELQAEQSGTINGAALYTICKDHLNRLHNEQEQIIAQNPQPEPSTPPSQPPQIVTAQSPEQAPVQ